MSEEQLSAFLTAVKADACLQDKLKGITSLSAFVQIANESGFEVSEDELLRYQAKMTSDLSDAELESFAGGTFPLITSIVDCMMASAWGCWTIHKGC